MIAYPIILAGVACFLTLCLIGRVLHNTFNTTRRLIR